MTEEKKITIYVPHVGESITEVTLAYWSKKSGEFVEKEEIIAEIESDKATFEILAEISGELKILAPEGTTLAIGSAICTITSHDNEKKQVKENDAKLKEIEKVPNLSVIKKVSPSPIASKILAEKGVDPTQIQGTGPQGKIIKQDAILATKMSIPPHANQVSTFLETHANVSSVNHAKSNFDSTLAHDFRYTPILTTFDEVDMEPILQLKKKYKEILQKKYTNNISLLSFFVHASCIALKEYPKINASLKDNHIIHPDFYNIAISMYTSSGYVAPNIKQVEKKSLDEIEKIFQALEKKAQSQHLTVEDITGGTFTIMYNSKAGAMFATPMVYSSQVATLGLYNTIEKPVVSNKSIVIKPIMYIALSYNSHIVDDKSSIDFLKKVKFLIENPLNILLAR